MKNMPNHLLRHVIGQVVVEALPDIAIDRLELDEDERQPVDEADEVGAAVAMRDPRALKLHLAHGHEAVVGGRPEVDNAGMIVARFTAGVAPRHRHAALNVLVELMIMLEHRASVVHLREFLKCLLAGRFGKIRVQAG